MLLAKKSENPESNEMKRRKSPLLLRKTGGGGSSSDGTRTPKQTTPPTSSSSLLSVPPSASGTTTTVTSGTPVMGAHSNVVLPTEEYFSSEEIMEWDGMGTSLLSNGSAADSFHLSVREGTDDIDAGGSGYDAQRTRIAIDSIHQKIGRTKELIKSEQNTRDGIKKQNFFTLSKVHNHRSVQIPLGRKQCLQVDNSKLVLRGKLRKTTKSHLLYYKSKKTLLKCTAVQMSVRRALTQSNVEN